MQEFVVFVVSFLLVFLALGGSLLPVIPGPPFAWLGLLLYAMFGKTPIDNSLLWWSFVVMLILLVLDYSLPIWGAKKMGASKRGIWGSFLGGLVGLFFGLPGILIGPFVGALIGEWSNNNTMDKKAFKAAFGTFLGFLVGVLFKFIYALFIGVVLVKIAWSTL